MPDENTKLLLSLFTDIPMPEIEKMISDDIVAAKRVMAYEITKLIHGDALADQAVAAVNALFADGGDSAAVPTYYFDSKKHKIPNADAEKETPDSWQITVFAAQVGLTSSSSETRRLIEQGGLLVDEKKITDPLYFVTIEPGKTVMLQKGKKTFLKVIIK
jgi:tyrosyl-tRNA synthetase